MSNPIAELTKKMLKRLPFWFRMKKDTTSIGAQFLNVIGMELDEVKAALDYATDQFYIDSVDLGQVDMVYKATIPIIPDGLTIELYGDGFQLQAASTLTEFLTALETDVLHNPEVFYSNPYYLDMERRLVYVRFLYGEGDDIITMTIADRSGRIVVNEDIALVMHPIWNFLDEFGLLLECPRLMGESNGPYKERILAVFQFPANSSRAGLLNGVARDLSLVGTAIWVDGSWDMPLPHTRINTESLLVDGAPYPDTRLDASGRTVLVGSPDFVGVERRVRYTHGVSVLSLSEPASVRFRRELYDIEGHGTARLQYYVALISGQVPLNWGQFIWDQGFWDIGKAESEGGVMPSFHDASVSGWRVAAEGEVS
jgi:hypothetical protein